MLIDSHCHLNREEFNDVESVIQRAKAVGIQKMLTICTSLEETPAIIDLAVQFEELWCSVGVHPHDAAEALSKYDLKTELQKYCNPSSVIPAASSKIPASSSVIPAASSVIPAQAGIHKIIALGETGLDFYYENSPRAEQIEAFNIHIDIAKQHHLPVIVHTRQADADTINCLQNKDVTGVMHCFSGTAELARQSLDMGFYISISGIVTFKNADDLREIVKFVPLDRLLVETDAPFLAPVPHRGKRNEPAFMIETVKKVAELKGVSVDELGRVTTENFGKLFTGAI